MQFKPVVEVGTGRRATRVVILQNRDEYLKPRVRKGDYRYAYSGRDILLVSVQWTVKLARARGKVWVEWGGRVRQCVEVLVEEEWSEVG